MTVVAVLVSAWLFFLAGIASAACAWVDRHQWVDVDG